MKGSSLIIGQDRNNKTSALDKILKRLGLHIDDINVHLLESTEKQKSIGIDQIRKAQSFIISKPKKSQTKCIVIMEGHKLTVQAQNALLKTLEEPPEYASIIILINNESDLLDTVVSRCRKILIDYRDNEKRDKESSSYSISEMSLGERLIEAELVSKKDKEQVLEILNNLLVSERELLKKEHNKINSNNVKILNQTIRDLQNTNVVTRLAVENCFLKLKHI